MGEVPEDGWGPAEAKQIPGISSRRKKIEGFRQCAQFKSPTVTKAQDQIVVYFKWFLYLTNCSGLLSLNL